MRYESMQHRIIANSIPGETTFNGTCCWIWIGHTQRNQRGVHYPYLTIRVRGKPKPRRAHRESVKAFKPWLRVTRRTVIAHLCNQPLCVNPLHLAGGTQRQNMLQCVADGRHNSNNGGPYAQSRGSTTKRRTRRGRKTRPDRRRRAKEQAHGVRGAEP